MIDTKHFKERLEKEKIKIESELSGISKINPLNPNDWEAVSQKEAPEREPDRNEQADNIEDYEESYSLNDILEKRLNEIKKALKEIEDGVYGKCAIGEKSHEIESERLEANPAATTCIKHKEEEK